MEQKKQQVTIQSVERAMAILELLCRSQKPLSVAEISEAVGLKRTTVYGLLNTLIELDYVADSDMNNRYEITSKMYRLSLSYPERIPVVRYARNYMLQLSERFDSVVHLGILNQSNDVMLIYAQMPISTQNARSGSLFPLHATGLGKTLLAFLPEEKADRIIENLDFQPFTRYTITDPDALRNELAQIRAQGYARDNSEYIEQSACVAFPIFGADGSVSAALSITSMPEFIGQNFEEIVAHGLAASKNCSIDMGWQIYR